MMFEDLKKEKIIVDLKTLIEDTAASNGEYDEDMDAYCTFMKGLIMSTSGLN